MIESSIYNGGTFDKEDFMAQLESISPAEAELISTRPKFEVRKAGIKELIEYALGRSESFSQKSTKNKIGAKNLGEFLEIFVDRLVGEVGSRKDYCDNYEEAMQEVLAIYFGAPVGRRSIVLAKLNAIYGVTRYNVGNDRLAYTSTF